MKYIVRNCPAFTEDDNRYGLCFDDYNGYCKPCKDITECLLKRIVNELRNDDCDILYNGNCFMYKNHAECCNLLLSEKILELLEIEECENEQND